MKRIALLLALGCQACAQPSAVFSVSDSFTDAQMAQMQSEADKLCVASGEKHCLELVRGNNEPNRLVVDDMDDKPVDTLGDTTWSASDPIHPVTYRIRIKDPTDRLALTIRHEFGHVAGCRGHLSKGNVMAPAASEQSATWTDADVKCLK